MLSDIEQVLFTGEQLSTIVEELGATITADYQGKKLVIVCVLKGAAPFAVDLMRQIQLPLRLEFVRAASYGARAVSSGQVQLFDHQGLNLEGEHVLVVEDILDTGKTLSCICGAFAACNPKSLAVCTLFDKPDRREMPLTARYVGRVIPDHFVVGYGLDYNECYRNLPLVGVLKPCVYQGTAN